MNAVFLRVGRVSLDHGSWREAAEGGMEVAGARQRAEEAHPGHGWRRTTG